MPVNITESSVYAPSVAVPIDSEAANVASVVAPNTGFQALADRTRNLVGRVGGTSGLGEHEYVDATGNQADKTRTRVISPIDFAHGVSQIIGASTTVQYFSVAAFSNTFALTSQYDRARIVADVSKYLPEGATLTRVEAMVTPGVIRGTVADRMFLDVSASSPVWGTPAIPAGTQLANVTDDGTLNVQVIDSLALTEVISRSRQVLVLLRCGIDSGTNKDDIHSLRLSFNAPGPNAF